MANDHEKMREACANIAEYAKSAQCHTEDAHVLGYLRQMENWAEAALALPRRQCDVGTAEQQAERMRRQFCAKQKRDGIIDCSRCPIRHAYRRDCTLAWAQMPNAEGGAK